MKSGNRWETLQVRHGENPGPVYQTLNRQRVLLGIEVGDEGPLGGSKIVERRCLDRAVGILQRRKYVSRQPEVGVDGWHLATGLLHALRGDVVRAQTVSDRLFGRWHHWSCVCRV